MNMEADGSSETLVPATGRQILEDNTPEQGRIQAQAAAQGGRFEEAASKLSKLLITTTPFHLLTERYSMNADGNFNLW